MKINNDGLGPQANSAEAVGRTGVDRIDGKQKPATAGGDSLTLSSDAQTLRAATEAAAAPPAIRQDVVERMKALLDAGQVGNDAGALADAIIDDLLQK